MTAELLEASCAAGPDGDRRQARRSGFRTKGEAQEALDTLRTEVREGTYFATPNATVREFLVGEWLPAGGARSDRPRGRATRAPSACGWS